MDLDSKEIFKKLDLIKKIFLKEQNKIQKFFFYSLSGVETCKKNSKLIDQVIKDLFNLIKVQYTFLSNEFLICAVGGYGRKQLAPYSDIDILIIHQEKKKQDEIEKIVKFILYPIWDLGFKIGHAVRTYKQTFDFLKKDHMTKTSMLDSRLIVGSKSFYKKIMKNFEQEVFKTRKSFLSKKILERKEKIIDINFDYFKNEPNIKESEGSLRDINLIFWGLKILGISKKFELSHRGILLSSNEKKKIQSSLEFLLTIRCFLHYKSKRQNDKLSFDYQKIIASKLNKKKIKKDNTNVEIFMKNYFMQIRNTKNLANILSESLLEKLKKEEKNKKKLGRSIFFKNEFLEDFLENLNKNKIMVSEERIILDNINKIPKANFFSKATIESFKKILFSGNKKESLIKLNDLGILPKIVPEFKNIVSLTQFDRYHLLTVDQHTLRAINILKDIKTNKVAKKYYEFSKNIFKKEFDKKPLFYATLLHDIGKGYGGDHNLKGANMAKKIILRFNEKNEIAEETSWLIENHLIFSEFAFKKDLEDDSIIKKLCSKVTSLKRLRSLFLLTVSDISAVDHGLWNQWKASLLQELYLKCEKEIQKPDKFFGINSKIEETKSQVLSFSKRLTKKSLESFSKITYPNYWLLQSPSTISFQIENFFTDQKKLKKFDFCIKIQPQKILEIIVVTDDRPRLLLDLISIFVSERISVLEARIFTLDDNSVIDTFKVSFNKRELLSDFEINEKIFKLEQKLKLCKKGEFIHECKNDVVPNVLKKKVEINIDNYSSSTYTVFEVTTNDRPRLLYDLLTILIENNLVISMAKISTNGDFAQDSFHIRNKFGFKLKDGKFLDELEKKIKLLLSNQLENAF